MWMKSDAYQGIYTHYFHLLLAIFLAVLFSLYSLIVLRMDKGFAAACVLALLGVSFELVRFIPLSGFSFNAVGLPLAWNVYSLQVASIGGIFFLSFVVLLTNLLAYLAIVRRSLLLSFIWAIFLVAPYVYGGVRLANKEPIQRFSQGIVVGSYLHPYMGRLERGQKDPIERVLLLQRALAPLRNVQADWLCLPEGMLAMGEEYAYFPSEKLRPWLLKRGSLPAGYELSNGELLCLLSRQLKVPIVAGLEVKTRAGTYNAAALFGPAGFEGFYGKQVLIPIAEEIPFPWLKKVALSYGIQDSYIRGRKSDLFMISGLRVAPNICYEETFPFLMRKFKKKGAQMFLNLTNDVWYPGTLLAKEHLLLSRIRAVENGLPVVRSCNAGVSAVIGSYGEVWRENSLDGEKEDVRAFLAFVPIVEVFTLYSFMGELWFFLIIIALFSFVLFKKYAFKKLSC